MKTTTSLVERKVSAVATLRERMVKDPSIVARLADYLVVTKATVYGYLAGDYLPSTANLTALERFLR